MSQHALDQKSQSRRVFEVILKKVFLFFIELSSSRSWSWWSQHLRPPCLNNSLLSIKFKSNLCIKYSLFYLFFIIWLTRFATAFNWVIIRNYKMDYFFYNIVWCSGWKKKNCQGEKRYVLWTIFQVFFSFACPLLYFLCNISKTKKTFNISKQKTIDLSLCFVL